MAHKDNGQPSGSSGLPPDDQPAPGEPSWWKGKGKEIATNQYDGEHEDSINEPLSDDEEVPGKSYRDAITEIKRRLVGPLAAPVAVGAPTTSDEFRNMRPSIRIVPEQYTQKAEAEFNSMWVALEIEGKVLKLADRSDPSHLNRVASFWRQYLRLYGSCPTELITVVHNLAYTHNGEVAAPVM